MLTLNCRITLTLYLGRVFCAVPGLTNIQNYRNLFFLIASGVPLFESTSDMKKAPRENLSAAREFLE